MMIIKSEKGVSAVEFALLAPFLFVLTFGIIELGILLFDKAVITNASREGARAAIVFRTDGTTPTPLDDGGITAIVTQYVGNHLIDLGTGNKTPGVVIAPSLPRVSGTDVTVTVTFTYDFLVFSNLIPLLSGGAFDGSIDLVGRTVMRME
jgi:Flp pilus assembly protein TadG